MKKLVVHYSGWGEDWPLGQLADDGRQLLFEYSPEALAQGLELSPLHLKLRAAAYLSAKGRVGSIIWMSAGWETRSGVHTCWNLPGREVFRVRMQKP